ncbi:hypothetical protein C1I95_24610 [Micromonospora craterilacus]|uniref:Uncharacterized protein n=1 Tax=Micromonospora craterilacus TaxID=1655439 RepID=A0A2W2DQS6_9ACTN|nr:hypothetical protein [Micromonospora craterilacus]PZG12993.1 hypothetical protein C1I95_24610 [Micromonospora craterilacus]
MNATTTRYATPTVVQRRALLAAIDGGGRTSSDPYQLRTIAAMLRAGWVTEPDGRTLEITDAGREAVAPDLKRRADEALAAELSADPDIKAEAVRLMAAGFRNPWAMARDNVEAQRARAADGAVVAAPTADDVARMTSDPVGWLEDLLSASTESAK